MPLPDSRTPFFHTGTPSLTPNLVHPDCLSPIPPRHALPDGRRRNHPPDLLLEQPLVEIPRAVQWNRLRYFYNLRSIPCTNAVVRPLPPLTEPPPMPLRFRRSLSLFPGARLNFSKSGMSVSLGRPGATLNVGPRGSSATFGLPGMATIPSWLCRTVPSQPRW